VSAVIRAGIAGLGRWGQRLVVSACEPGPSSKIRFVRAATRSPSKVSSFAAQYGLEVAGDFDSLLDDTEIDAVVLATPHSLHVGQIMAAAAAGKHVFVEKPIALELIGARQAVEACRQAGVVLAVGFNRRFLPAYQHICERHQTGSLGQALHIEGAFSGPFGFSYHPGMWRGSKAENPAGGMAAMGIHVLDAMIHLMGPVKAVQTISRRQVLKADIDDTTSVVLRFCSGATGYFSTLMATAPAWRLQLFGSDGWAGMPDQTTVEEKTLQGELNRLDFHTADIERLELEAFADKISGLAEYPVTENEILSGVASMEAISRSAQLDGQLVQVDNTDQ